MFFPAINHHLCGISGLTSTSFFWNAFDAGRWCQATRGARTAAWAALWWIRRGRSLQAGCEIWLFECWHLKMWKLLYVLNACIFHLENYYDMLFNLIYRYWPMDFVWRFAGSFQNHQGSQVIFQVKLVIFHKRKPNQWWYGTAPLFSGSYWSIVLVVISCDIMWYLHF